MTTYLQKFFAFSTVVFSFFIVNSFSLPSGALGNEPEVKKSAAVSTSSETAKKVEGASAKVEGTPTDECEECHHAKGKKSECAHCKRHSKKHGSEHGTHKTKEAPDADAVKESAKNSAKESATDAKVPAVEAK